MLSSVLGSYWLYKSTKLDVCSWEGRADMLDMVKVKL